MVKRGIPFLFLFFFSTVVSMGYPWTKIKKEKSTKQNITHYKSTVIWSKKRNNKELKRVCY